MTNNNSTKEQLHQKSMRNTMKNNNSTKNNYTNKQEKAQWLTITALKTTTQKTTRNHNGKQQQH